MAGLNAACRAELLALAARDAVVRAELAADGTLFGGYHPQMEAVHRANAARLRELIAAHGWPGHALAGEDGAEAAWRIAQHAVGEPDFMRACRELLRAAAARGDVPRWQFAMIDDRIRTFEGRPQRYGSQLREGEAGLEPCPLEDARRVEEWRRAVGLPPLAAILERARPDPPAPPADREARAAAELAWRQATGWRT